MRLKGGKVMGEGLDTVVYLSSDPPPDGLLENCIRDYAGRIGCVLRDMWGMNREPHQKPRLDIGGLNFSISHSRGLWVCGVSRQQIGIDVEYHRADCQFERIAKRFFHPEEYRYLERNGFSTTSFYPLWTAKESYVKYTGTGISDLYSSFSAAKDGALSGEINGVLFRHYPVRKDYSFCLCTKEAGQVMFVMAEEIE